MGIGLIAVPVIGAVLVGPTNPYSAVTLILAGLASTAIACAIAMYRIARAFAPVPVAVAVGLIGGVPPILPMFGSTRIDLTGVVLYGVVLATVAWLLQRESPAGRVFVILWAAVAVGTLLILSADSLIRR